MRTKKEHLENYQKRYFFGRRFLENLFYLGCGGMVVNASLILFSSSFHYSVDYVVSGITLLILVSLLITIFADINDETKKVREKIKSLETKVEEAKNLFESKTLGIDPSKFNPEQITLLRNLHTHQNKLYKKQAYLEMIGG